MTNATPDLPPMPEGYLTMNTPGEVFFPEDMTAYALAAVATRDARISELEKLLSNLCTHKPRTSAEIDAAWDAARAALSPPKEQQ